MAKVFGSKTKIFDGKKYDFYWSWDHSRDAYENARQLRKEGINARVVEVKDDFKKGGPGFAVYMHF